MALSMTFVIASREHETVGRDDTPSGVASTSRRCCRSSARRASEDATSRVSWPRSNGSRDSRTVPASPCDSRSSVSTSVRQAIDLLEHAADCLLVLCQAYGFRRGRARRCRESPTSGVRSSCDASAVKRRADRTMPPRRANVSLITAASRRFRRAAFGTDTRSCRRSAVMRRASAGELIDRRQRSPRQDIPADARQHDDQRQTEHQHDSTSRSCCSTRSSDSAPE